MIAGAYRPDAGRVEIDGIDVRKRKIEALARLGVLHEDFGLYPRLTVVEHVRFAGSLHGLRGRALAVAVDGALVAIGLNELRNRRTAGMSHGERMKVALARTLVHEPRNIVLDEPTRGLDIFSVRALRDLLKRLRDQGACVLMSSHAMAEVMELSDRVIVIERGSVLADECRARWSPTQVPRTSKARSSRSRAEGGSRHEADGHLPQGNDRYAARPPFVGLEPDVRVLGPLAVVFTVNVLAAAARPSALQTVAVCNGAAPALVEYLQTTGLTFAADAAVCLDVPPDYERRLAAGQSVRIAIRADMSSAAATVTKLETEIGRYSRDARDAARARAWACAVGHRTDHGGSVESQPGLRARRSDR